jgi:hypothetical protein
VETLADAKSTRVESRYSSTIEVTVFRMICDKLHVRLPCFSTASEVQRMKAESCGSRAIFTMTCAVTGAQRQRMQRRIFC